MPREHGKVTVILGNMYSGKSTRLLHYVTRASIAGRRYLLVKPRIDNRYSDSEVVSHDGARVSAVVLDSHRSLTALDLEIDVILIDEVQFFSPEIWRVVDDYAARGVDVYVAGLSTDFMGQPFEASARVAMIADSIENLTAVCSKCGDDAVWTQMVVGGVEVTDGERVQVGGSEMYEPRCRRCFVR
jgi:thymidine kinase